MFLACLRTFLLDQPRVQVVGSVLSGLEAIERVSSVRPDLVLLDLIMPGMNGFEVLCRLKALPSPPAVVLLSLQEETVLRARAAALGADGFVSKPELGRRLVPLLDAIFS